MKKCNLKGKEKFIMEKRNLMKDREVLESDKFVDIPEEKMLTKNRRKQILHTKMIAFHNKGSKPKNIIGISEDNSRLKKVEEKLTQTQSRLTLFNTIIKTITSGTSVNQVVKLTVNKTSEYFKDLRVSYSTIRENGNMKVIYSRETQGMSILNGLECDLLMTPDYLGSLRRREPVIIENSTGDQRLAPFAKILSAFGSRALLGAAVADSKKITGLLCLHSREAHQWSNHEKKTIKDVAHYLSIAINHAHTEIRNKENEKKIKKNLEELSKKSKYESSISRITRSVHQSIDLQEVMEHAVASIRKNIDLVDAIAIYLVEGKEAVLKSHRGLTDRYIKLAGRIPYPKGFTWKTIIDGKPRYCPDVDQDAIIGSAGRRMGIKSYLAMPFSHEDKTLGIMGINSFQKNSFGEGELRLLEMVARQIEIAINNAKQAEAIQESKEKYRALIEQSNDWVWEVDINGSFTYVNPKVREIIGYEPEELLGKTTFDFMSTDEAKRFYDLLSPYFSKQRPFKRLEKKLMHKDGHEVILEVSGTPMFDSQGFFKGYLGVVEDVTQRRNQEKKIHHFAMHDYMTDLPNRRSLEEELTRITNQNSVKQKGALLMIDLDNFKLINDTLGHFAGDQLLKDLSNALAKIMRPRDMLARMGGDEFVVVLQNVSQKEAKKIVDRLFKSINEFQFNIKGYNLNLNCSIGITLIDGESSIEEILQKAYSALSQAKSEGKNRIIRYGTGETIIKTKQASNWKIRIKEALKLDRYTIEFQPVVRLDTEKTEFFEALIRMKADNGQIVFAKSFIHFAERFGLISEIDRWMVEKITHFLASHPSTKLSINLSGSSLRDKSLLSSIERYIREGRISAEQLVFEITELSAIKDLYSVQKWMNKLQILNARFALDDFGSGFSSFTHLQALPVDFVKIDVSFISKIKNDLSCYAIVDSIASVAHVLGKEVIAEGVENHEIIKSLQEFKIEFGQGRIWKSENLDSLTL
jgi:diguanylate cyclase (GGDEF)-like protein/PAS domain S-box-containing protein